MQVWGINEETVRGIVHNVSDEMWEGNVEIKESRDVSGPRRGASATFTLRVASSRGSGAHMAGSGRRTVGACWHVHRDVVRALFHYGATRVKSAFADYRSLEHFEEIHEGTYSQNVGSMMAPASYGALCECAQ